MAGGDWRGCDLIIPTAPTRQASRRRGCTPARKQPHNDATGGTSPGTWYVISAHICADMRRADEPNVEIGCNGSLSPFATIVGAGPSSLGTAATVVRRLSGLHGSERGVNRRMMATEGWVSLDGNEGSTGSIDGSMMSHQWDPSVDG